ncbi:MAG TPA: helix-turn-helix domain-containing protein [Solirubrobacteraceae bacterium]|nr:helix-turn-helix domain-containing protein [Solirubrobacteraceae bacterium]
MADIGSTLRESRMRARIDISEVEVGTKIRAKYLRALENEEWDLLPGPVYVKSFLKTYGDFLGLDSRLLVDEFKRRYERPSDHEVRAVATTTRERDRHSRSRRPGRVSAALLTPRTVIVFALVVIVVALYLIGNHSTSPPAKGGNAIAPATKGSGHHHGGSGKHARTGTTINTVTTNTVTAPVVPKRASLKLVATATVWVCVENQAGKPLMSSGDVVVGQKLPTFHAKEILLALGNTGVTMTADGKPYTPSGAAPIALRITATGVKPLTPAPTCA